MSFVSNVLAPIIQTIIYLFMIGGVLYFIYRGFKALFPNFRLTIKYKVFRRRYKEEDVEWCMGAIERGMNVIDIKKYLLIKGTPVKKVNEMAYIFKKVNKEMKGGNRDNGKQS